MLTDWSRIAAAAKGRICFLVRGLDGGGAQRDAILLANELQGRGYASAVVTLEGRGHLAGLVGPDVPILDLGRGGKLRLALAMGALRCLFATGRPRVMVCSEAAANAMTVLASRLLSPARRPTIILREVASPVQARTADPYWQNRLAYKVLGPAYRRADLVLTFTRGVRDDLIAHFGVPAGKVVSLGTNAVLTPQMRERIDQRGRRPEAGLIVSVGRLSSEKDFSTLIEAFALLRKDRAVRLVLVGEGNERANLEALITARRLGNDVVLAGHDPNPLAVLARASLYVSSSRHEGLGNALIEAMAVGVPVVATDAPHGPREILQDGRLGTLVEVGDPRALAAAMAATLDAPIESAALQARAAEFSVEAAAERFIAVLGGLIAPSGPNEDGVRREAPDRRGRSAAELLPLL